MLLSFGTLIPWLGYYWDDWPVIFIAREQGAAGLWEFLQFDRPLSTWMFLVPTALLGSRPIAWHLFALLVRWSTVVAMWWTLRNLWPQHARQVTWAAFLFAVYPAFDQQPVAVTYSHIWLIYTIFFLSLAAMLKATQAPARRAGWTGLALFTQALHLVSLEYYFGLELTRPLFLWLAARDRQDNWRGRLGWTLRRWMPYAIVLAAFVIWRMFFLQLAAEDPNNPQLLVDMLRSPISALARLFELALQDFVGLFATAWYRTTEPINLVSLARPALLAGLVALLAGGLAFFYLRRLQTGDKDEAGSATEQQWWHEALLVGLPVALLGALPVWLTGRQALVGLYGSRFAMATMFGAAILTVAVLEWLTPRRTPKLILIAALVGLAAGYHIRTAVAYIRSWEEQTRFYWELSWRAPHIEPHTAVLSANELFPYVGIYSTATALNLAYPYQDDGRGMAYWFFDLYRSFGARTPDMKTGEIDMTQDFRSFHYEGDSRNNLVVLYEPEEGKCLWLLTANDKDNPELDEITVDALPVSNLERIHAQPSEPGYPPAEIFGAEPPQRWCYYYQKANLAHQMEDWEGVAALGDEALARGYTPNDPQEWIPFVEGYAYAGRWQDAVVWMRHIYRVNRFLAPRLCRIWDQIEAQSPPPSEERAEIDQMLERFDCEAFEDLETLPQP